MHPDECDLTTAQHGALSASLTSACLRAGALHGTKLAGANLTNAAITNVRGEIMQQYYGEDGKLTEMFAMRYPAGSFPAATSFSNSTNDRTAAPTGPTSKMA